MFARNLSIPTNATKADVLRSASCKRIGAPGVEAVVYCTPAGTAIKAFKGNYGANEASQLQRISKLAPGLAPAYIDSAPGWVEMELLTGHQTPYDVLKKMASVRETVETAAWQSWVNALVTAVATAVGRLHNAGVLHNDLHGNNVLVLIKDGMFEIKIIDFSGAKECVDQDRKETLDIHRLSRCMNHFLPAEFWQAAYKAAYKETVVVMPARARIQCQLFSTPAKPNKVNKARSFFGLNKKDLLEVAAYTAAIVLAFGIGFSLAPDQRAESSTPLPACNIRACRNH